MNSHTHCIEHYKPKLPPETQAKGKVKYGLELNSSVVDSVLCCYGVDLVWNLERLS